MANFFTCPECFEESACGCAECSTTDILTVRMSFLDEDHKNVQCPHCLKISSSDEWLELSEMLFDARMKYTNHIKKKSS